MANVCSVGKSGWSAQVANYHPISLTCIACKLMERIINVNLLGYLDQHKLISKAQHGFLYRRPTTTNVLETINDLSLTINKSRIASTVYIDFSRAFDSVCHNKLFCKSRSLGIEGNLLSWIISFLSNRTIRTLVGSALSNSCPLRSGVVQGCCIGPLLFVLFVNDVEKMFSNSTTTKLFADDLKLYTELESIGSNAIQQKEVDLLSYWCINLQLTISIKNAIFFVGNVSKMHQKDVFINAVCLP